MDTLLNLQYDWLHNKIIYDSPATLFQLATVKNAVGLCYDELKINVDITLQIILNVKLPLLTVPKTVSNEVALMVELIRD